jgi:hypothetical protein
MQLKLAAIAVLKVLVVATSACVTTTRNEGQTQAASYIQLAKMSLLGSQPLALQLLIRKQFKLTEGNDELIESCRKFSCHYDFDGKGASIVILEELWKTRGIRYLKDIHKIPFSGQRKFIITYKEVRK